MDTTAIAHMQETKFFKSHSTPLQLDFQSSFFTVLQTACTETKQGDAVSL